MSQQPRIAAPFDPLDPAHHADPFGRLAEARGRCPVSQPHPGMHFVARDEDVRAAFRDYGHFSSKNNFTTESGTQFPAMITQLDPPGHTLLRRLLMPAFMPPAVAALEEDVRRVVTDVIDALPESRSLDVMSTVARVAPGRVVYRMIGLPTSDMAKLQSWADVINAVVPEPVFDLPEFQALTGYLVEFIATRRSRSTQPDDLAGRLLTAEIDGRSLTDQEVLAHLLQLIAAGTETTTSLIGNLLYRLLSDRRWWEKLVADRSLVPAAVEESLRLDAPLQWVLRTSDGEQHLAQSPIRAGERVVLGIQSANRDDAAWGPHAEQFEIDRPHPERHVSFGCGIHLCLGAPVARLEARVLLAELLERYPGTTLAPGYSWEPWDSTMVWRPRRLDLVLQRAVQ